MTPEEYIAAALKEFGISITDAARMAHISYQALWRCLRNKSWMKVDVYLTLRKELCLDPRGYREEG